MKYRTKLVVGLLAVFLMLMIPSISAIEYKTAADTIKSTYATRFNRINNKRIELTLFKFISASLILRILSRGIVLPIIIMTGFTQLYHILPIGFILLVGSPLVTFIIYKLIGSVGLSDPSFESMIFLFDLIVSFILSILIIILL